MLGAQAAGRAPLLLSLQPSETKPASLIGIDCHTNLAPLSGEWDELADRAWAPPWLRPGWIRAWRSAFGRGRLQLFTLRREGRLAAVLPLERRFGALRSTSNWHTPVFALLAEDDTGAAELADGLFARAERRIGLAFLDSAERSLAVCRSAAERAGCKLIVRTLERSPYVSLDGDWAAYESRRAGKLLRELRRRRRRLSARGRLWLDVFDATDQLAERLEEGFRVEAAGWKGRRGTAIVSAPATLSFYREIAAWAAERGWLRLAFLRLDKRPIAFDFCLEESGVHYLLKTGYDAAYREFAPGVLLRQQMLARAFSSGLKRYEFLGAAEPWKLEWAEDVRERKLLQAFSPSAAGFLDWSAFAFGRPLARRALAWHRA
jgi:CelD/BcsL family acetyltransferase involved in cellulose biosynthesis